MYHDYKDKLDVAMDKLNVQKLKPVQAEIMPLIMAGEDVVAILPTGAGKSLLYQLPSVLSPHELTIVIAPLIALQQDQLKSINSRMKDLLYRSRRLDWNGRAILNSTQSKSERREVLQRVAERRMQLLYLAPE